MAGRDPNPGGFDLLRMLGLSNATGTQPPSGAFSSPGPMRQGGSGKAAAESYFGRSISGQEYDALIRATHAESSAKNSPEEQAMIMGSILNRARTNPGGIIGALNAPNQFQSVTGTKYAPGPSRNYREGPDEDRQASIESAAANLLSKVPTDQTNFTAASQSAYGRGTNIGYLAQLQKTGGAVYGGTQFSSQLGAGRSGPAPDQPNNIFAALFNPAGIFGQTDTSRSGRTG